MRSQQAVTIGSQLLAMVQKMFLHSRQANHPNVIAVSAIADSDGKCGSEGDSTSGGADDSLASFSNYGPAIDMAAQVFKFTPLQRMVATLYCPGQVWLHLM